MLPLEPKDQIPEHPFLERHETLSLEEKVPSKSFHQRMQRDPNFRDFVEAHD